MERGIENRASRSQPSGAPESAATTAEPAEAVRELREQLAQVLGRRAEALEARNHVRTQLDRRIVNQRLFTLDALAWDIEQDIKRELAKQAAPVQ